MLYPALLAHVQPTRYFARTKAMRIDSHLHVWASEEESVRFPYMRPPTVRGNTDYFVDLMAENGVDKAMLVQSSTHGFDHSYTKEAMNRFPDKFIGCLLADPDNSGSGVAEMERLVKEKGFKCVRFNPYIWPDGQKMTNKVGRLLYEKAGDLSVPVGFMLFNGLLTHVEEVETFCEEIPKTKVILDHFGFCKNVDAAWAKLIEWSKYEQVYVKASAFFRNTDQRFPYLSLRPRLREVIDAYGAERVMWGTDFPWVVPECGYDGAWNMIEAGDREEGRNLLSKEEKEWLMSKTFERLILNSDD